MIVIIGNRRLVGLLNMIGLLVVGAMWCFVGLVMTPAVQNFFEVEEDPPSIAVAVIGIGFGLVTVWYGAAQSVTRRPGAIRTAQWPFGTVLEGAWSFEAHEGEVWWGAKTVEIVGSREMHEDVRLGVLTRFTFLSSARQTSRVVATLNGWARAEPPRV
ncbi:hypothetical protein HF995_07115 [Sanguibacter hominis ATCC BAA-789]|uniref:Uncharacterized protein n=1 Tax=Sanguibacter hominis ATCC BAA-789 TaxID=1312740 RepID=A0A9X5FFD6_9MICO|nr:hypothetical protein [Sanguibacter hominis]NKX93046.1 hypothetical protein [Sanguibacter hominis ATCC BAA-789]